MKRRDHGDGGIDARGPDTWRLRYRIKGKRYAVTVHGTKAEAKQELRKLLRSGDSGEHVPPDKLTVGQWVDQWIAAGAPGRKKKRGGRRTVERYAELMRCHVVPTLGARRLQQLQPNEIDALYVRLEGAVAPTTAHHVHSVFGACLHCAVRKGLLAANPMARVEKVPAPGEADHGIALDADQLRTLVRGFTGSVLYPVVAVLAFTGCRRNEALALRWSDLDVQMKTVRIERAIEMVRGQPLAFKGPKSERGKRTITIDDDLLALLVAEREKHVRLVAGVPEAADVDLSLIKLPDGALVFPNPPAPGEELSLAKLRNPRVVTRGFIRKARKLGFSELRLHDLRGTHETLLLDAGVPVHVVAARCGHDPAVLLRTYAKRTKKADTSAAAVIGALANGVLS